MKTYKNLYKKVYNYENLFLAWRRARKGKTRKFYVKEFQENLIDNLELLNKELEDEIYNPKPLKTFILRDPKTRKISKANFRDRVVHHAVINVLEPIYIKIFICDCCANIKKRGNLFAINRFDTFKRKVSKNGKLASKEFDDNYVKGFCLKADIKHYFQEINHKILIKILREKIKDEKLINLIRKILINGQAKEGIGMPLGNLTSQFLANVYLTKLDYFVKHELRAKYYLRYVDDFVILHENREQLDEWKDEIDKFLKNELEISLHPDKSKVTYLSKGVDFVGFKNFYNYRILRKRNIKKILHKIDKYNLGHIPFEKLVEIFIGWNAYAKWANSYKTRKEIVSKIYRARIKREGK